MDKISTPGVYDIDMDTYHGDCAIGPSVSGSGLVKIENTSPAHFWHASYFNPNREDRDTGALRFGRAAHAWILGQPEFEKEFVVSPYDEFRSKEAKAWREKQTRDIVKPSQLDAIKSMSESILRTPLIQNAFKDGKAEQSIIWKDKETGIWLKTRPDWLPNTLQFVPNYKTCRSSRPSDFTRAAFELGYHQGAALCLDGLREVLGWDANYYFVAQEKLAPYVATLIVMKDTAIEWGRLQNRSALRKLAECINNDTWPGYASGAVEIDIPAWTEKGLLDRHEAGEFQAKEELEAA